MLVCIQCRTFFGGLILRTRVKSMVRQCSLALIASSILVGCDQITPHAQPSTPSKPAQTKLTQASDLSQPSQQSLGKADFYFSAIELKVPRPPLLGSIYIEPSADTWPFNPSVDSFSPSAVLDLTFLNKPITSHEQRIVLSDDKNDFSLVSGENIRFWAVNIGLKLNSADHIEEQVRFLVKRGVNMVRLHTQIYPKDNRKDLSEPDQKVIDSIHLYSSILKKHGVYLTLSPYWANHFKADQVAKDSARWPVPRSLNSTNFNNLLFFDPILQAAYKNWMTQLLSQINPHTGIALKDDPVLAVMQLQNEDSLLFWTFESLQGEDLRLLKRAYFHWLVNRYGSSEAVVKRWQGAAAGGDKGADDWQSGEVAFIHLWQFSQPVNHSGKAARMADQLEFIVTTMHRFNSDMVNHIQTTLKSAVLVNAGNWRTANARYLEDLERYSYSAADIQATNRYVNAQHIGEHASWAIVAGQKYVDASVLVDPEALPLAVKQPRGAPFLVTESGWIPPLSFQAEGPFLVSLFQSLGGVDGFYWFTGDDRQWRQPSSANGYLPSLGKWVFQGPMILGQFPAAAFAYRSGLIPLGQVSVVDHRSLEDMVRRVEPRLVERQGFDPNRDRAWTSQLKDDHALAFLTGRVELDFSGNKADEKQQEISSSNITNRGFIASNQQIEWDVKAGIAVVNAPAAQGSCGFHYGSSIKTQHLRLRLDNPYSCVWLVALDGKPLDQSAKILLQMGTRQFATGWKTQAAQWSDNQRSYEGREIVEFGRAPWQIEQLHGHLTLQNSKVNELALLDPNGLVQASEKIAMRNGVVELELPKSSLYAILR